MIDKDIQIEDLLEKYPNASEILSNENIKFLICGEPVWSTLEEAVKDSGFDDEKVEYIVNLINESIK
jgi:iron-sulfur cluster repair protein YtfE (RIC family)